MLSVPSLMLLSEAGQIDTYANEHPQVPNELKAMGNSHASVILRANMDINQQVIDRIDALDLEFSLGDLQLSQVEDLLLVRGKASRILLLVKDGIFDYVGTQTSSEYLNAARDVSIPEIKADDVWSAMDSGGRNITGEEMLIADIDSGIDWRHPDFWFADGEAYDWMDFPANAALDNGTDCVDLNNDSTPTANETIYIIDLDRDGSYNVTTDWLWADNVTQNVIPDPSEPFFVTNDTNSNGVLDLGENLIMLSTPKTKYIVEGDGTAERNIQSWVRGVNLTSSDHKDTDGHGTAVSGILLGGQLGYRKYVGVAPKAELMMLKALGMNNEWLTVEESLTWAFNHDADVILLELGSWTYNYLDGSSAAATLIDTIVSAGVPVVAPSGNLGGKEKHALFAAAAETPHQTDFRIPKNDSVLNSDDLHIEDIYITVLSVNDTDFTQCNFSLIMNLKSWGLAQPQTIYLHPGTGYESFVAEPPVIVGPNTLIVESFVSTSTRSTEMLGIWIHTVSGTLPTTNPPNSPPFNQLNVSAPSQTTFHCYISDDKTSWTGGARWVTDISDYYQITWPSTADDAISVASYRIRSLVGGGTIGDLASFSSRGPRIDGILKQGIAAPGGYDIIGSYSNESDWSQWYNAYSALSFDERFGSYRLFSGTSASGPHVAGTAALMLQANSTCGSEIGSIIKQTGRRDSFTGDSPSAEWGYGKLDSYAAVANSTTDSIDTIAPNIFSPTTTPEMPTELDEVIVTVEVEDLGGIDLVLLEYNNETHWQSLTMTLSGENYSAIIPAHPSETNISYRIIANDTASNSNTTGFYSYVVQESTTTTTTTMTTTTTTTTTDTTTTDTETPPLQPDFMRLAIALTIAAAVVVFGILYRRRRS